MTVNAQPQIKNPGLAAILSFLFGGLGQIYNGEIGKGILIIVVQIINGLLMLLIIGFITAPIVWIWSIYDAYKVAEKINQQAAAGALNRLKTCPQCATQVPNEAKICSFCGYQFVPMPALPGAVVEPSSPAFSGERAAAAVPVHNRTLASAERVELNPDFDSARAWLEVVRGPTESPIVTIYDGLVIGRYGDVDVRLTGSEVSRRHAIIRMSGGNCFLQDQGSANGTYVNGERITAKKLQDGDHIVIGDAELVFRTK